MAFFLATLEWGSNGQWRESERSRECRFQFQNITHFPPQHVIMGCLWNENNKRVRDVGGYTKMGMLKMYPEQKGWTLKSILGSAHYSHIFSAATRPDRPSRKLLLLSKTFVFSLVNALHSLKIVPESIRSGWIFYVFFLLPLPQPSQYLFLLLLYSSEHRNQDCIITTCFSKLLKFKNYKVDRALPVRNAPKLFLKHLHLISI